MIFNFNIKLKYDIKLYFNIFSNRERKTILNQFKPFLHKEQNCPGLQTRPNLHEICKNNISFFNPYQRIKEISKINRPVIKSWVNYTDDKLSYENWHTHDEIKHYEYTCCYMIENPENLGTWFKVNGKIYKTYCLTNSLLVFPNFLTHTVPPIIKKPRFSLTVDYY